MTTTNNPFGITIADLSGTPGLTDGFYANFTQVLADIVSLGLGWVRFQFHWSSIEQTNGVYDPNAMAVLDNVVNRCNEAGLSVQFPIQDPPAWRRVATNCQPAGDTIDPPWYMPDPTAFGVFASFLSSRYNGVSTSNSLGKALFIKAFEIGNEDFSVKNTHGGPPSMPYPCRDPKWFIPCLQAASPLIRANSPNALVGMGALWYENSAYHTSFMQAIYAANSGSLFDYANIHFYSSTVDPNNPTSPVRLSLDGQINEVYAVMAANGDTAKQVWGTEIGWTAPHPPYDLVEYDPNPANPSRSKFISEAFDILRNNGHSGVMNYYTMNRTNPTVNAASQSFSLTTYAPITYTYNGVTYTNTNYTISYLVMQAYIASGRTWLVNITSGSGSGSGSPTLTTVASDTFVGRTVSGGWGLASDGTHSWVSTTESGAQAPTLAVAGGEGTFTGPTNAVGVQLLGSTSLTDCDAVVEFAVTASGDNGSVVLRSNAAGTIYYRVSLVNNIIELAYMNNGTPSDYVQNPVSYTAGSYYFLRFRITGNVLQARFWAHGATEPNDFTNPNYAFTYTDTSASALASGRFGLRARTAGASHLISFDSFTASSVSSPPPPPPPPPGPPPPPPPPPVGTPHVCLVALENHNYDQSAFPTARYIVGNPSFPYINALITTYGVATSFYGVIHQSLGNYLALASGDSHGAIASVLNDSYNPDPGIPSGTPNPGVPFSGNTLVDSMAAASPPIHWKHYAQNLADSGVTKGYLGPDVGGYVRHHCPWVYFATVRGSAAQYNNIVDYADSTVGLAQDLAAGTAPPFFIVQPNNTNSGHNGGTDSSCDSWIAAPTTGLVALIQASSWYTQGDGQIVLWWDESNPDTDTAGVPGSDANPGGGHVVFVVINAQNAKAVIATSVNHYGLLRTLQKLYGLPYLGKSQDTSNGNIDALFMFPGNGTPPPPPPPGPPPPPPPPVAPPVALPAPLGLGILGMARLGDESMTSTRGGVGALIINYDISGSKYADSLTVHYQTQVANVAPVLVYYLITPLSVFSINGDATIIAPDQITYTPRPVVARTLLAGPVLQGYGQMSWAYSVLQLSEWQHLASFYNPANPTVLLTYPDQTGTWVQRQVEMLPPSYGQQQTVQVTGATLTFTGLLS